MLFREFQAQLPDDYIVMHSVGWLSRSRTRTYDGEVDFVIVHPARGILVLEVKGGAIEGEWSGDQWTSTSRTNRRSSIRNPIRQVQASMYALRLKLADDPRTAPFAYTLFRGVAFPDMLVDAAGFGPGLDRSLVLDSSDLGSLEAAVEQMYSEIPATGTMSGEAIQGLLDLLQPVVRITQIGLLAEMKQGDDVITELTTRQFRLLRFLQHHRRVVVNGCAGSGKTMLAIEKARLLAEEGFDVLLTCFNRNLADWMRSGIGQLDSAVRNRITVAHYHDLAVRLCEEAGRPSTVRPGDPEYWNVDLTRELEASLPYLERRFDAVIADEGQDFAQVWWPPLMALLRQAEEGVFYIFQDEQQAIYRRDFLHPLAVAPHELDANCRSTTQIHEKVIEYYGGDPKPESLGPPGRGIEVVVPAADPPHAMIGEVLHRLVEIEGLAPDQIVILTPNGARRSRLKPGTAAGALTLTWSQEPGPAEVRVSSVHAFKGLESPVVILAEVSQFGRHRYARELTYVALSRARNHLVIVGDLPAPA
jgi:hypothetical protein